MSSTVRNIKSKTRLALLGAVLGVIGLVSAVILPMAANAAVSFNYTLFGDASIVQPGNGSANAAQIVSDSSVAPYYGGVDFGVPSGVTTLSTLNNLSTDYMFTSGNCGLGAPRFVATVTTPSNMSENVNFYLGPYPDYNNCPQNVWSNTGNLASPTNIVDASQLGGGFYEPYASVQSSYGSYPVTDVFLVTDAGGTGANAQVVKIDNSQVDTNTYTYEPAPTKDSCKKGGWMNLTDAQGHSFKNQGDCVSYFANGGVN
ncbi:MAG TPA: hypothetical protein VGS28_05145 [Candidatus Saccharimonadales bacterium]|nr:hypothetical protein [Candidatus Saccharimonadales bacterium]